MAQAQTNHAALVRGAPPESREPLSIELTHEAETSADAVTAEVRMALPDADFTVEAQGGDPSRHHFVDFPDIDPKGQEPQCFALARALQDETTAALAIPVLPDSLYGAPAISETEGIFSGVCRTPRDDSFPLGWHHIRLRTPEAWATTRGAGSTVAVIDTGHSSHIELNGAIDPHGQRNFVEGGTDASDRFSTGLMRNPGHGTLVCSVVGSRGGVDGAGNTSHPGSITGTAPEAMVLPIRAIMSVIDMTQRRIPDAIDHAVAQGVDVIAMALGGPTALASTQAALHRAVLNGTIIVCAAGNCWPSVVYPAAFAPQGLCTAVAALKPDLRPWDKTGRGSQVSFSAFGEQVWGAAKNTASDPDHGIRSSQGTTLATSSTAGVAALWVARHGGRAQLLNLARDRGTTVQALWIAAATHSMSPPAVWGGAQDLGAGVLDAKAALDAPLPEASEAAAPPPAAEASPLTLLLDHLPPEAAGEVTTDLAAYAPELIWRAFRTGARRRALDSGLEAAGLTGDAAGADLARALDGKPALGAALGLD